MGSTPAASVAVPDYRASDHDAFDFAVWIVLQAALGEQLCAEAVPVFFVDAIPADPETDGYIELPDLAAYLRWRPPGNRRG